MNFLTYLFNSTKIPFEAPDNWQDVPFKTFVAYNKLIKDGKADDQAKVYNLFRVLEQGTRSKTIPSDKRTAKLYQYRTIKRSTNTRNKRRAQGNKT